MIRLPRTGLVPKSFVSAPWGIIDLSLVGYFYCFQLTAHAFIAYNRYTALNSPNQHRWVSIKMEGHSSFFADMEGQTIDEAPTSATYFADSWRRLQAVQPRRSG